MPIVPEPGAAAAAPNELQTIRNVHMRWWTWPPSSVPRSDPIHPLYALCETWVPDSKALRPSSPGDDAVRCWRMRPLEWNASDDPRRHLAFAAPALLSIPCSETATETTIPHPGVAARFAAPSTAD
jgi:hypothetical protein